jgi:hypothetical protein
VKRNIEPSWTMKGPDSTHNYSGHFEMRWIHG